jgi:quercetin dioxygenase-like cupin family protein
MKIQSTLLLVGSCALLTLVPTLSARQDPTPPEQKPPPIPVPVKITGKTLLAPDELKWTPMTGIEGARQAILWGDPQKGAHGVMYMWPSGAKLAEHSHTAGDRCVVLSGTLLLEVEGIGMKRLPAGSFFSLEGGTKHTTSVEASVPCQFYVEREGAYDVVPAK